MTSYNVAVIGEGLAGAVAALHAARRGGGVILIARASGATALSGGAIDLCGSPIEAPGLPWSSFTYVRDNLRETIARRTHHPYSVLALNHTGDPAGGVHSMMEEAIAFLREQLAIQGLTLRGDTSVQEPAPTVLGTWKLTSFVQSSQQLGVPEGRTAVIGIKGLEAPDPGALAATLQMTLDATGMGGNGAIEHLEVEMDGRDNWAVEEISAHLAGPGALEDFIDRIDSAAGNKYRTVLIPPVLPTIRCGYKGDSGVPLAKTDRYGFKDDSGVPLAKTEGLASALSRTGKPDGFARGTHDMSVQGEKLSLPGGAAVRELLATPPSTPGRRLQKALKRALESAGIVMARGKATDFEGDGKRIVSCSIEYDGTRKRVAADSWVLATGKYIGGGLKKNGAFRESAVGLPVFSGGLPVGEVFIEKLLDRRVLSDHPAFEVGLATDLRLRPVDADGKVIFKNLFAAGSVIGGYNYHTGTCGLGVCALTGYFAGLQATLRDG